jgi:uncharacterized iron-regulated membrane protein
MIRLLFLCHRYLGIAVGVLMAMWCLSGVVMMYVSYPALDESNRLKHLAPINWSGCCTIGDELPSYVGPARDLHIEMLSGRPVLSWRSPGAPAHLIDLITGSSIGAISREQAASVGASYVDGSQRSSAALLDLIDYDQWTVAGNFNADRPLYQFSLGDGARTELYISSTTGRAVQTTTARERFWNWLGAVPHWLYFARLRREVSLWSHVVIVTSLIGCFLAATGLYIGVRQLVPRPGGRCSPYHRFNLWHHIAGLVFGIFTLTWVVSGLLSMNPWGWLEGASAQSERALLRGQDPSGAQLSAALHALANHHPNNLVSIQLAPLDGRLYFIASLGDGERRRLDELGNSSPLGPADLAFIAASLKGPGPVDVLQLMSQEDTYYFSHHRDAAALPIYRLARHDGSGTLYYVDPVSGDLVAKLDRGAQGYRWWHEGLHRMDFCPALRGRPQWDALMLLLMTGVTVTCFTGAYLGYRGLFVASSSAT